MKLLRTSLAIARKDFRIETRQKDLVVSTLLFSVLVTVLGGLVFYVDPQSAKDVAPGSLWLALLFSGILIMGRSWARESEEGAIHSLLMAPSPRAAIFVGKAISAWCFLMLVAFAILPLLFVFFQLPFSSFDFTLVALVILGTWGFIASGTLFSMLTVQSNARDLVLSVVVFPLITPALLGAAIATREHFAGASFSETLGWMRILLAFDLVSFVGGSFVFEYLAKD
ncbi:MAG: heme exporter protein CcmB [Polyangiales bacterium]